MLAGNPSGGQRPKRSVIQGAALYPFREELPGQFDASRLREALQRLGVGALPMLPGDTQHVRSWLRQILREGGWALSDRATGHVATERADDWRVAASQAVLIGVLRGQEPEAHLRWVIAQRTYYTPLRPTQRRQLAARWVAIYSPTVVPEGGAVRHIAEVEGIGIQRRSAIATPWAPGRNGDEFQVVFRLGPVITRSRPIENRNERGRADPFRQHRWSTRLAFDRAQVIRELMLETEPEWRLYEELRQKRVSFDLRPREVRLQDEDDPQGRVWFVVGPLRARYAGAAGFVLRSADGESCVARVDAASEFLAKARDFAS